MNKVYQRAYWESKPSEKTPINESNLNKMDYALDEIDTRVVKFARQKDAMETATQNANTATANANTATANANKATDLANEATQSATIATNNANEAAKAIFDEKYILTARTEFNRSTSVSPTAKGNAILEKLRGDSWQRTIPGNQLLNYEAWKTIGTTRGTSIFENNGVTITATEADAFTNYGTAFPSDTLIQVSEGETITMSWETDATSSNNGNVYFFKDGTTAIGSALASSKKLTVTIPSGTTEILFRFGVINSGSTIRYKNIMINKGTEALQYEEFCGNTQSPNPSYPQKIRSVGDMGWFDGEWLQGYLQSGAVTSNTDAVTSANYMPCKENDTVKISYTPKNVPIKASGSSMVVAFYDSNNAHISSQWITAPDTETEITAPSGSASFRFSLFHNSAVSASTVGEVVVTINGKYALIEERRGKSLFQFTTNATAQGVTIISNDGVLSYSGKTTKTLARSAGHVTLSAGTYEVAINKLPPSGMEYRLAYEDGTSYPLILKFTPSSTSLKATFTLTSEKLVLMILYGEGTFDESGVICSITPETEIDRHYIQLDEPLRGVNGAADEVVLQEGVYGTLRNIIEEKLAELEWTISASYAHLIFYASLSGRKTGIINGMSNKLTFDSVNTSAYAFGNYGTDNTFAFVASNTQIVVRCDAYTDVESFREAMSDAIVQYELAEPTFTPFADQTPFYELMAYDEVTHVSIAGCHEELNPSAVIRFPRNEDGALVTTNWCVNKKNEIAMNELKVALMELGRL